MAQQKLMTKAIEKWLEKHPYGSQEDKGFDAEVGLYIFNPYGRGTWLCTEGEKQPNGDWLLFGYHNIYEWEWGDVSFNELKNIVIKPFMCKLEREQWSKGRTVREILKTLGVEVNE